MSLDDPKQPFPNSSGFSFTFAFPPYSNTTWGELRFPKPCLEISMMTRLDLFKGLRKVGDNILYGFAADGNPYRIVGFSHRVNQSEQVS